MRGKYRGKCKVTGGFYHGNLLEMEDVTYIGFLDNENDDEPPDYMIVAVDPATVGQYTGLKDREGRELFEDDQWQHHGVVYVVTWHSDKAIFYFKHPSTSAYDDDHIDLEWSTHGEKVGNRWDQEGKTTL